MAGMDTASIHDFGARLAAVTALRPADARLGELVAQADAALAPIAATADTRRAAPRFIAARRR
jgi:hypothetical protein